MDDFSKFVGEQALWFIALIVISGLLAMDILKGYSRAFKYVQAADAIRLMNHDNAVILDVRDEKDYKAGHIINAVHVPMGLLEAQMNKLERHKDSPLIVVCRTGQVSVGACNLLSKNGFDNVYNLRSGMMGWANSNLPTVKE